MGVTWVAVRCSSFAVRFAPISIFVEGRGAKGEEPFQYMRRAGPAI
jgi:hypothetical protein